MQDVNETTALPPDNTRIRSYEFYEVRTNLAHSGEQLMCRGSFETCDDYMNKWGKKVAERGNLYMLRVTLVRAHKRAGE